MWGPTLFFNVRISSCLSTSCWKDYLFPIEWSWHYCQKALDHIHEGYIWALYSIPLVYMFVFMARTHQHTLDYCSFVISFFFNFILFLNLKHCISFAKHQNKSKNIESFSFVLILKDYFHYFMSLEIHMNFRMGFSISAKNVMGS